MNVDTAQFKALTAEVARLADVVQALAVDHAVSTSLIGAFAGQAQTGEAGHVTAGARHGRPRARRRGYLRLVGDGGR